MQISERAKSKLLERIKLKTWKVLVKNVQMSRDERQIEQEHDLRKAQIDNFFENLKKKVDNEKSQRAIDEEDT